MRLIIAFCASALLLAGCSTTMQTSSGADYLARYDADLAAARIEADYPPRKANAQVMALNEEVREAALVEPLLRLPARIGVAKIRRDYGPGGHLAAIPESEALEWAALAEKLGPNFGEFVPVNPLVARMVAGSMPSEAQDAAYEAIREARLGAARQHLDAVLIYDIDSGSRSEATAFSAANWTLLGAFILPGRENTGQAQASAMLVDARNGYPYAMISAEGQATRYSSYLASGSGEASARRLATSDAFEALMAEAEEMALQLALNLDRADSAAAQ